VDFKNLRVVVRSAKFFLELLSNGRRSSDLLESVGFLNPVKIVLEFLTESERSTDLLEFFSNACRSADNFLESLKRNALSESLLESVVILIESLACEKGPSDVLDCLSDKRLSLTLGETVLLIFERCANTRSLGIFLEAGNSDNREDTV
jgi:hypothetical protein